MKRKPGRPKLPKGEAKGKIVPIRFTKAEADGHSHPHRIPLQLLRVTSSCSFRSAWIAFVAPHSVPTRRIQQALDNEPQLL